MSTLVSCLRSQWQRYQVRRVAAVGALGQWHCNIVDGHRRQFLALWFDTQIVHCHGNMLHWLSANRKFPLPGDNQLCKWQNICDEFHITKLFRYSVFWGWKIEILIWFLIAKIEISRLFMSQCGESVESSEIIEGNVWKSGKIMCTRARKKGKFSWATHTTPRTSSSWGCEKMSW